MDVPLSVLMYKYFHNAEGGFDYRDGEKVATDYNGTYSMVIIRALGSVHYNGTYSMLIIRALGSVHLT